MNELQQYSAEAHSGAHYPHHNKEDARLVNSIDGRTERLSYHYGYHHPKTR